MSSACVVMAPMTRAPPVLGDALQLLEVLQIDEMLRRGEAQLHHRDQAVAAGDDPRLVASTAAAAPTASLIFFGR